MGDILDGEIAINSNDYKKEIFSKKGIIFGDKKKIDENNNYFSIIIGKNGVGKSSFLEYIIEDFQKNKNLNFKKIKNGDTQMMYITYSAFDKINYQDKNEFFIYNGLKNKANGSFSSHIYNSNKLKFLNFLKTEKGEKKINNYINNVFNSDIDIKINLDLSLYPNYNIKGKLNIDNIKNLNDFVKKIDDEINIMLAPSWHFKGNDLKKMDSIYLILFYKFYKKLVNTDDDINFSKLFEIFASFIEEDETTSIINKTELFINTLDSDNKEEKKYIDGFKELQLNIKDLKTFLMSVNIIRDKNSMGKAVDIDFLRGESGINSKIKLHKNLEDNNNLVNASSGEMIMLLSILHLSDFNNGNGKKIILIDEPEISLHPQWQKEYFEKINQGLDILGIKNCFFVITTHSPLIVLGSQKKEFSKEISKINKKFNTDIYGFMINKELNRTISNKIEYINMKSVDDILGEDFGVSVIDEDVYEYMIKQFSDLKETFNKRIGKQ